MKVRETILREETGIWHSIASAGLVVLSCITLAGAAEEVFTYEHVAKLRSVGNVRMAPDGKLVAYTLSVPRTPYEDKDGAAWSELHVAGPEGKSRPFITGEVNIGAIEWTPDGTGISFLAKRGDDEHSSLYVIPVDGGEAKRILSHDEDITTYSWSPDGKKVAFLAREKKDKNKKKLEKKGFKAEVYEEDWRRVRVWIATPDDEEDEPEPLDLDGSASELHWSPTGDRLALALAPTPLIDDHYMKRKIHTVDPSSGKVLGRLENPGKLGQIAWSPDGRRLAVVSAEDLNDPREGRLMVGSADGGALRDLLPDYSGHVSSVAWRDRETILYLASEGTYTTLGEIGADGKNRKTHVAPGGPILGGLSLAGDGASAAFGAESPTHSRELYVMAGVSKQPVRWTTSNPWMEKIRLAPQEVVTYKARDGLEVEGILIRPLDEKKGKRYPLILVVHGGPESHYSNGWMTSYSRPGQFAAAEGYAVFHPNYRGSTGRGVEFSKLHQADYAGGEFDDLVDGVDHLVKTGLVDRKKVGVTGGSYGGFASAWCATKLTEHFAASVMMVGISDHISKAGTTDIPNEMFQVHSRRWPWEHWDWFRERSPLYHVEQARTPILILHGKEDTRVHPSQSMELYRYLKLLGKTPVRLVFYPGEGHGNRKAASRFDYSMRLMRWMAHYLKGPGGDPPPYALEHDMDRLDEKDEADGEGEESEG